MQKKRSPQSKDTSYGQEAEKHLAEGKHPPIRAHHNARELHHDLEVHQIELELQNAELRRIQKELAVSEEKFRDLYEFGPTGYYVFDPWGTILELNLAGASLLGKTRMHLLNQKFQFFLEPKCLENFNTFCTKVMSTDITQKIELQLKNSSAAGNASTWILMEGRRIENGKDAGFRAAVIDISDRKQIESNLQETSEYLESLIRYANAPIIVWDPELQIVRFNRAFEKITGHSAKDVIGRKMNLLFPPETRDIALSLINQISSDEHWESAEIPILTRNGSVRTILWNSANIYRPGTTKRIATIAQGQDITERKEAEKSLRLNEERYRTLFTTIREGFVLGEILRNEEGKARDYRFLDVNPAFERIIGLLKDIAMSRTASELFPNADPGILNTYEQVTRTREPVRFETYMKSTDRWYEVYVYSPAPGKFANIFTDITERKRSEEFLRITQEWLNFAQKAANAGFWGWNIKKGELTWSEELFTLFGIDSMVTPSFDVWLDVLHPEDREGAMERINASIADHTPLESLYRIIRPDGMERWITAIGSTEYDAEGHPLRMSGICIDTTEREKTRDELIKTRDLLENLINYANAPIIVWDPGFRITRFNHAFEHLTGYRAEEVIGESLGILLAEPWKEEAMSLIQSTRSGEHWESVEIPIRRKDGSVRTILWNSATLFQPGTSTILATIAQGQDITERKEAERALRMSEERYRRLFNTMGEGFIVGRILYDEEGTAEDLQLIEINPAYEMLTGFSRNDALKKSVRQLMPDLDSSWVEHHRMVSETGQPQHWEGYNADTGNYFLIYSFSPEPGMFASVLSDITERKRIEKRLKETTEKLQVLFHLLPVGISVIDDQRVVKDQNQALEEILGLSWDQVVRGDFEKRTYLHPDGTPFSLEEFPSVQALKERKAVHNTEIGIEREDGSTVWTRVSATPLPFQDWQVMLITEDITDQKKASIALKKSEEETCQKLAEIESIYRSAPVGLCVIDNKCRFIRINEELAEINGVPVADHIGRTIREVVPYIGDQAEAILQKILETGQPQFNVEISGETISQPGVQRFWNESWFPLYAGREIIGVNIVVEEITERKRTEQALQEYAESLKRSNEELERFAYVASHDLQEPLRSVISYAQLLSRRYKGHLDTDADDFIDFIVDSGKRMQALITDLLEYSRVSTRGKPLQPMDPEQVLSEVLKNLETAMEESGATITHDPLPLVQGDALQVQQVLQNLIENAIKFRSSEPLKIQIGVQNQGTMVRFSIRDNGIGIAPEFHQRIFVIFQRLHSRKDYPGTGIGLAICKRIVERHGGRIWVESGPGQGSTFFFTLPLAREPVRSI